MVLYAAGTALNDVFDLEIDRAERPNRPLPSGRVAKRSAAWLGGLGLVFGPALALGSGSPVSGFVALILAGCILGYDAGLKHTGIGPALMGACRGLNLLLGMSHAPALGGPICWLAAFAYGLYVAGITLVSRSETRTGLSAWLLTGLIFQDVALLGMAGIALEHPRFPHPATDRPLIPVEGILVLGLVALALNSVAARAIQRPTPDLIQKTVKTGILSLVWLNVGLVAAVRGLDLAALIALLWLPAFLLGRWLYST
jgi:4-hydroxybenzoate polyprenyltransferase